MRRSDTLADEEFLRRFLGGQLEPADFDHRGHLRAAWLTMQHYPVDEAVEHTCAGIARLAEKFGAPAKYNRTMSEALVRLMAHASADSRAASLEDFLRACPEFASDVPGLLARYYSAERLHGDEARTRFLSPDREPLPG